MLADLVMARAARNVAIASVTRFGVSVNASPHKAKPLLSSAA